MTERYESALDKQIREAAERGDFDDLPGTGKPLPDRNELYDEDWWLKQLLVRENIGAVLPTTLRLRKDIEDLPDRVAKARTEEQIRAMVSELNRRIADALRGPVDGPVVPLHIQNADALVAGWKASRNR